jgi:hypothetical protein
MFQLLHLFLLTNLVNQYIFVYNDRFISNSISFHVTIFSNVRFNWIFIVNSFDLLIFRVMFL